MEIGFRHYRIDMAFLDKYILQSFLLKSAEAALECCSVYTWGLYFNCVSPLSYYRSHPQDCFRFFGVISIFESYDFVYYLWYSFPSGAWHSQRAIFVLFSCRPKHVELWFLHPLYFWAWWIASYFLPSRLSVMG